MSTLLRRRRASRIELGAYKRHELLTGEIRYPALGYTGYGDGVGNDLRSFIDNQMRSDWANNRDQLMAFWVSGEYSGPSSFGDALPWLFICGSPDTLPWGARNLDP